MTITESCCGAKVIERSELLQAIVMDDRAGVSPSCFQKLLCDCSTQTRFASGVKDVPEISNLAGLLVQNGEHSTAGTAFTAKWGRFDKEKRIVDISVYGSGRSCGSEKQELGQWSAINSNKWRCLMMLGRCCDYSYKIRFAEDWQRADIDIRINLCCVACCVPPCMKAWFTVPPCIATFDMEQAEDSQNGSHWIRQSSKCGGPKKKSYNLQAVYGPDGSPTEFVENLKVAPEKNLISR
jgi:hypothetical protein